MNIRITAVILSILFLCSCNGEEIRTTYYENGKVKSKTPLKNGIPNGFVQLFYDNGNLECETEYHNGKENGQVKCYFYTGELQWEAAFHDGKYEGVYNSYNLSGKLVSRANFKDGVQDGFSFEYYDNGITKTKTEFVQGVKNGEFKSFYQNGQIELDALIDNEKTVFYKEYSINGKQIDEYRTIQINPKNINVNVGEKVQFGIKVFGTNESLPLVLSIANSITNKEKFIESLTLGESELIYSYTFQDVGKFYFIAEVSSLGMEERKFVEMATVEVKK